MWCFLFIFIAVCFALRFVPYNSSAIFILLFFWYCNCRYWTPYIMIACVILCVRVCERGREYTACQCLCPLLSTCCMKMSEIAFLIFIHASLRRPVHPNFSHSADQLVGGGWISIKFNCWTCYKIDIMLIESGYNSWWCEDFFLCASIQHFGLYFIASCNLTDCKLILIPQNIKQPWRYR